MDICMDIGYVIGGIRQAHFEGKVNFSKKEEEDFQVLLRKDLNGEELTDEEIDRLEGYKEEIIGSCELIIDWYDIEDTGDYHWMDCLD